MASNTQTGSAAAPKKPAKSSISMHDNVPVWHDCCCCEAEPYWVEAMQQVQADRKAKKP